ncbi:trinucleotide repeat-containing gene 6A protein [Salmo salar]|uniref:Trinucleotide repeat-containing gene 6A protein n=1 Tax=Salmo salar TaxID=8030 RepID=A0ABM3E8M7_SALSA|nr:trinucleotide repeat-containing gene 6A protein-like [Salmo salar]
MTGSPVTEALAGDRKATQPVLRPPALEDGGTGREIQAQSQEGLPGQSRRPCLGVETETTKALEESEDGRTATLPLPGVTARRKISPTPGRTLLNPKSSRAGAPLVVVETAPEEEGAATGASPRRLAGLGDGTTTATVRGLEDGVNPATRSTPTHTPTTAAAPGVAAEGPTPLNAPTTLTLAGESPPYPSPDPSPRTTRPKGGWGESAMKPNHPSQNWGDPAPPSDWGKSPDSNSNPGQDPRGLPPGGPQPSGPGGSKPSGWTGGAVPVGSSHKEEEPTGWEEPSPESVRRRMEIDDGTSAWGDPNKYNCSGVNMWNKTSQSEQDAMVMTKPPQTQQPPPPLNNMADKDKTCSPGWGEQYGGPQKMESGTWCEPSGPPVSVDNGTSAWGKPMDTSSTWEELGHRGDRDRGDNSGTGGWEGPGPQNHHKPGPKPMHQQESNTWCGEEVSCQSSWEPEEEVEIGMWSNAPSHRDRERDGHRENHRDRERDGHGQDNRNNGPQQHSWNYMKKIPPKMNKSVNKQEDAWMTQFVKQFNNMNYVRDSPEDLSKSNKMEMGGGMMSDKRMDVNMGEYSGVMGKNPASRHQIHKEPSMERSPYYDKLSLPLSAYDRSASEELSSNHGMSFSPSHSAQPIPSLCSGQAPTPLSLRLVGR